MTRILSSVRDTDLLELLDTSGRLACRSTRLDDLDLSMSDFMACVAALEERCGIDLADHEIARCVTLGDLFDHLRAAALRQWLARTPIPRSRAPRARTSGPGVYDRARGVAARGQVGDVAGPARA